jgi:hypothetical protein
MDAHAPSHLPLLVFLATLLWIDVRRRFREDPAAKLARLSGPHRLEA